MSEDQRNVDVEFTAESTEYDSVLEKVTAQFEQFKRSVEASKSAVQGFNNAFNATSTDGLSKGLDKLNSGVYYLNKDASGATRKLQKLINVLNVEGSLDLNDELSKLVVLINDLDGAFSTDLLQRMKGLSNFGKNIAFSEVAKGFEDLVKAVNLFDEEGLEFGATVDFMAEKYKRLDTALSGLDNLKSAGALSQFSKGFTDLSEVFNTFEKEGLEFGPTIDFLIEKVRRLDTALGQMQNLDKLKGISDLASLKSKDFQLKDPKPKDEEKNPMVDKLNNYRLMFDSMQSLSSAGRGKMDFSSLINTGFSFAQKHVASKKMPKGKPNVPAAGGVPKPTPVGGLSGAAATVGLAAIVVGVYAMMAKLGHSAYETQMKIVRAQLTMGNAFKDAYSYAKQMNAEMKISEDRTLALVSATAKMTKQSGMSNQAGANMGIGINKMATDISTASGEKVEDVHAKINSAVMNGDDSLSEYGIPMDDNAIKYLSTRAGHYKALGVEVSDARMKEMRYWYVTEQMNRSNIQNASTANTVAARWTRMNNAFDNAGKNAKEAFLPIFMGVAKLLEGLSSVVLKITKGFSDMGFEIRNLWSIANGNGSIQKMTEVEPISKDALDSMQSYYSEGKKMGDMYAKLKNQLFSFDEVITITPYDPNNNMKVDPDAYKGGEDKGNKDEAPGIYPPGRPPKKGDGTPPVDGSKKFEESWSTVTARVQAALAGIRFPVWNPSPVTVPVTVSVTTVGVPEAQAAINGLNPQVQTVGATVQGVQQQTQTVQQQTQVVQQGLKDSAKSAAETKGYLDGVDFGKIFGGLGMLASGFLPIPGGGSLIGNGVRYGGVAARGAISRGASIFGRKAVTEVAETGAKRGVAGIAERGMFGGQVGGSGRGFFGGMQDAFKNPFKNGGSAIPGYDTGGFSLKPHLAQIGMSGGELALPLHSKAAEPAYRGIADNLMGQLSKGGAGGIGGVATENHYHLAGPGSTIIADSYSLQMFIEKIADGVEQRLVNTGKLNYGAR